MARSALHTSRWTSGAHDHLWTDAANWTGPVPVRGGVAEFGRGPSRVDLDGAATTLDVGQIDVRGGAVRIAGGVLHSVRPLYEKWFFAGVGLRIDAGGSLTVEATAALLGMHTVALGDVSAATLDVRGTLSDGQVYAGRAGAVSVTVEGAGSRWSTSGIGQSFQFGGAAAASLVVRDGGHVVDGVAWPNLNANSTMTIGGTQAGASVLVTDPGSELRFQIIDVGGSYSGTLDIAHGAKVVDLGANIGALGDASVSVSGPDSLWDNLNGVFVHGTIPHGTISVTDRGTLRFGAYGLQLGGDLGIDGTARLVGGAIVMAGGALSALASTAVAQSTVTVSQSIELSSNPDLGGSNLGDFFGSAAGVTLVLTGQVAPQTSLYDPLAVGGGHVVLANPGNGDFAMTLYGGVLEFSQAGASGSGQISFMDTAGAMLQFDQTGTVANPIAGFGLAAQDVIDLQAVTFDAPPGLSWQSGPGDDSLLRVSDGTHAISLSLGSGYRLDHFGTASDAHGGTALTYHR